MLVPFLQRFVTNDESHWKRVGNGLKFANAFGVFVRNAKCVITCFDEAPASVIASLPIQLARLPVSPEGRNQ
jgi:hypothetical protein